MAGEIRHIAGFDESDVYRVAVNELVWALSGRPEEGGRGQGPGYLLDDKALVELRRIYEGTSGDVTAAGTIGERRYAESLSRFASSLDHTPAALPVAYMGYLDGGKNTPHGAPVRLRYDVVERFGELALRVGRNFADDPDFVSRVAFVASVLDNWNYDFDIETLQTFATIAKLLRDSRTDGIGAGLIHLIEWDELGRPAFPYGFANLVNAAEGKEWTSWPARFRRAVDKAAQAPTVGLSLMGVLQQIVDESEQQDADAKPAGALMKGYEVYRSAAALKVEGGELGESVLDDAARVYSSLSKGYQKGIVRAMRMLDDARKMALLVLLNEGEYGHAAMFSKISDAWSGNVPAHVDLLLALGASRPLSGERRTVFEKALDILWREARSVFYVDLARSVNRSFEEGQISKEEVVEKLNDISARLGQIGYDEVGDAAELKLYFEILIGRREGNESGSGPAGPVEPSPDSSDLAGGSVGSASPALASTVDGFSTSPEAAASVTINRAPSQSIAMPLAPVFGNFGLNAAQFGAAFAVSVPLATRGPSAALKL